MYKISYSRAAERYFKKIKDKHLLAEFKSAIDMLKFDPYVGTQKVGDLRGVYGYNVKHNRVDYELAYRRKQQVCCRNSCRNARKLL